MRKIACITLDVEPDYGQDHIKRSYLVDEWLLYDEERLKNLFDSLEIKLTAFVVGEILEKMPSIVDSLQAANAEVELHSYSHSMNRDPVIDIRKGIKAFKDAIGENPLGYRAPQGLLTSKELRCIDENGFKFDSSVFPFLRFGKFCNLTSPQDPYFIKGSSILELPLASVPVVRFPIALSYMMLLGWSVYEALFTIYGLPRILVFDFHLHDLFPSKSFHQLSKFWRAFYTNMYRKDPWKHFVRFIRLLHEREYTFLFVRELYEEFIGTFLAENGN